MIKKYKQFTESLLNKLTGPSKDELLDYIMNSENPFKSLLKAISLDYYEGIQYIIKTYPNDTKIQGIYSWYETYLKKWFSDTMKLTVVADNKNIIITDNDDYDNESSIYYINAYTKIIYLEIAHKEGDVIYYYNYDTFWNKISNDSRIVWKDCEYILLGLTKYYFNEVPDWSSFSAFGNIKYER